MKKRMASFGLLAFCVVSLGGSNALAQVPGVVGEPGVQPAGPPVQPDALDPSQHEQPLPDAGGTTGIKPSNPSQRHPLMPNGTFVPLNTSVVQGSYNTGGVATIVECALVVGSDTPNGANGDTSTIIYAARVSCNTGNISKSGTVNLFGYGALRTPPQWLLASAPLSATSDPTTAHGQGTYTRSPDLFEQVQLQVALTLPALPNATWTTTQGCTFSATRQITCTLWSPPFQYVPVPMGPDGMENASDQPAAEVGGAIDDAYESPAGCSELATNVVGTAIGDQADQVSSSAQDTCTASARRRYIYYLAGPGFYARTNYYADHSNGRIVRTFRNSVRVGDTACVDLWMNYKGAKTGKIPGTFAGGCQLQAGAMFEASGYDKVGSSWCRIHRGGPSTDKTTLVRGRCRHDYRRR